MHLEPHRQGPIKGARCFHLKSSWGKDDRSMDLALHLRQEYSEKKKSLGARLPLREDDMTGDMPDETFWSQASPIVPICQ